MGLDPLSVVTNQEADALLEMGVDCICYSAMVADSGEHRLKECIDEFCKILESGKNIVTTSIPGLTFPKGFEASAGKRLETAYRAGDASLLPRGSSRDLPEISSPPPCSPCLSE